MISYIVASHRPKILADNLIGSLALDGNDEVIVVEDPPSIAVAYNQGQSKASNAVRCYVHSDVRLLASARLRAVLAEQCTSDVGMVGLIGSRTEVLPWWSGDRCGSVIDARMGTLDFGTGGECAYLDGLLLATAQDVDWDEAYAGFHLYDHDMCQQMLACGLPNVCLTGGAQMVLHNTRSPSDVHRLDGWDAGVARFREKWGMG